LHSAAAAAAMPTAWALWAHVAITRVVPNATWLSSPLLAHPGIKTDAEQFFEIAVLFGSRSIMP
jgi:hypothetical protein